MKASLMLAIAAMIPLTLVLAAASAQPPAAAKVRVGTYDSRAIAVAYAASAFNPVKEKIAEYATAKQAGDSAKMKQLEAWGVHHQRMLHFQGFGRVPVKDLLAPVRDGVAQIAADARLSVVTMECDFTAADAEVVDVTDQLVELFSPSDKTRKTVQAIRAKQPESLIVLADMPADK